MQSVFRSEQVKKARTLKNDIKAKKRESNGKWSAYQGILHSNMYYTLRTTAPKDGSNQ